MTDRHHLTAPMRAVIHPANGLVYWTPNGVRFYLGKPNIEHLAGDENQRPQRVIDFVEVKHPRTLRQLRKAIPAPDPIDEDDGPDTRTAMLTAAGVCDAPSRFEREMAARARERRERYGR